MKRDSILEESIADKIHQSPVVTPNGPNFRRIIAFLFMTHSFDADAASSLLAYLQAKQIYERGGRTGVLVASSATGGGVEEGLQAASDIGELTANVGARILFHMLAGGVAATIRTSIARKIRVRLRDFGPDAMPFPKYGEFKSTLSLQ